VADAVIEASETASFLISVLVGPLLND